MKYSNSSDTAWLLYLVFKAGDTKMEQIQQAVDLQYRQIKNPAFQESSICILQHPQETHQESPAALSRQRAGLAPSLVKTNTHTQCQSFNLLQYKKSVYRKGQKATDRLRGAVVIKKKITWEKCKCCLTKC